MNLGAWVLLVAVLGALAFGSYRALTDGRFRGTHQVTGAEPGAQPEIEPDTGTDADEDAASPSVLDGTPWAADLGERLTLLQFSSAFCAPCRATRRVLADAADRTPGVTHLEVDAEQHLDLVRRLGILRTPTTLVLDAAGRELSRAAGAPTRQQVDAILV